MQVLPPDGQAPPVRYANGIAAGAGRIAFMAGKIEFEAAAVVPK